MPGWLRRLRARIKYRHFDRDLSRELDAHRAMAQADAESTGAADREDAGRRVALQFGNATLAREDARSVWIPHAWQRWSTDALWAWRGLRARRWRVPLIVLLLGFALAANTLLFAVADSLLFRPVPYRDAQQLITLASEQPGRSTLQRVMLSPPALLDDLRLRRDVFADVHGYLTGTYTFIMDAESPQQEPTTFVTPGLIEMLGWAQAVGRRLTDADAARTDPRAVLAAHSLAVERFGSPALAVGRTLTTSEDPLLIVGVMPKGFQFPDARTRLWRPLDYLHLRDRAVYPVARLAAGLSPPAVTPALAGLSASLAETRVIPAGGRIRSLPVLPSTTAPRTLLLTLIGAGVCLLIIACANIASLEIAGALGRSRTLGIQVALGATRSNLVRTTVIEGAGLVAAAVAVAAWAAWAVQDALATWLPVRMTRFAVNPVDIDARALAFMAALAALAWLAVALPVALHASRRSVVRALNTTSRQTAASLPGTRIRGALTVVEVALAVVLLIGGVLYARTYTALIGIDKGFDSSHVVGIDLTLPVTTYAAPGATTALLNQTLERLRARSDVRAVTRLRSSIFEPGTTLTSLPEIDDRPPAAQPFTFTLRTVDASFFETLRLPIVRGRLFETGEDPGNIVITPALAELFWPGQNPVGHRLRTGLTQPWLTVLGVVGHVRYAGETPGDAYGRFFEIYVPPPPAVPSPAKPVLSHITEAAPQPTPPGPQPNVPRPGAIFMFLNFAARLDPRANVADIERDLRQIDSRFGLKIRPVDATYAEIHKDRLLAARTIGGFATLSFVAAMAGLYGVMAFLITGRKREIGIRLALGAGSDRIRTLVLGSAVKLVAIGGAIGLGVAALLSRWTQSQFYGVVATDPATYGLIVAIVMAAAIAATWLPARQASRVDPAITLRDE